MNKLYEKKIINIDMDGAFNRDFQYRVSIDKKNIEKIKLFRYRSLNEYTLNEFIESVITLSSPNTFNDPYDSSFIIKNSEDFWPETFYWGKEFEDLSNPFVKKYKDYFRVACFSETIDNPVMWSHYADRGKGFVLQYSYCQVKEYISKMKNTKLLPVFYENFKLSYDISMENNNKTLTNKIYNSLFEKGLFLKDKEWEYENEWRLILGVKDKIDNNQWINDYYNLKGLTPECIYLGEYMHHSYKKMLIQYAKTQDVPVFIMYSNAYANKKGLEFMKINANTLDYLDGYHK